METTSNKEIINVQQTSEQTGQVNNQAATVQQIVGEAVNKPSTEEQAKAERLDLLDQWRITGRTVVEPETYSLSVDGIGIFALGDIHAVKGKQKSGKSAALKIFTTALMSRTQFRVKCELENPVVLFVDTEQQMADVKLVVDEVKFMSQRDDDYLDQHLFLYSLRRMNYDTLINDTRLLIDKHRPQVVFIDGLVDYVSSFNDEVLSRQLIHELLLLCEEYHCAIVNVLHENKATDDENMRGHLGTVLSQKAGTILKCYKSKDGIISVTCPDARHGTMPEWHIFFDGEGHIASADELWMREKQAERAQKEAEKQAARDKTLQERLDIALGIINDNGGSIERNLLTKSLEEKIGLSRTTCSRFITEMVKEEKLYESGKMITTTSEPAFPF